MNTQKNKKLHYDEAQETFYGRHNTKLYARRYPLCHRKLTVRWLKF